MKSFSKKNAVFSLIVTVIILIRVWMISGIPKQYLLAGHDDLYFAKMAHYLIHGQWMGPYSQMTLIKGPFYGFFLVMSSLTGLPLFLNETFFYIFACVVMFFAISPLIKNRWWRLLLFGLLLFVPASLTTGFNLRVYREFVYFSLSLFVVAFSIGLFLRIDRKIKQQLIWVIGLGLSMGAFLITREEGIWIYPSIFSLLGVCIVFIWVKKMDKRWLRTAIVSSAVLLWFLPTLIVSYLNYTHYEFWGVTEQLDKNYTRVIDALGRIKTSNWYPYSPINPETIEKAAKVSPHLAELKDSIDLGTANYQLHVDSYMVYQSAWFYDEYYKPGEAVGMHFTWMFRDVLASHGYYASGKFPREELNSLANELETACDTGTLDCWAPTNIPVVTSLRSEHIPIIIRFYGEDLLGLLNLSTDVTGIPSLDVSQWSVYQKDFQYFDEFTYNPVSENLMGNQGESVLSDGHMDLRIKTLDVKETIIKFILKVYTFITLPIVIILGFGWFGILIFSLIKKKKVESINYQEIAVIAFVLSLLLLRTLILSILSATSTIVGRYYGASNFIYLYLFIYFVAFSLGKQIIKILISLKPQVFIKRFVKN
ncbi:MAG: hypothetical protein MUO40_14825 [Anaerolineaceae bacterium]|nr:hypothetical protein [Anaerolineaceae bacterium]